MVARVSPKALPVQDKVEVDLLCPTFSFFPIFTVA